MTKSGFSAVNHHKSDRLLTFSGLHKEDEMSFKSSGPPERKDPFVVGISGGSAAGKTMVAQILAESFTGPKPLVICVDRYFLDQSHLPPSQREKRNYDIPEAIDFNRLARDIESLINGREVSLPVYDYATHSSLDKKEQVSPTPIIIVEGILLFYPERIKPLLDYRIFVDVKRETRLSRRIRRDTLQRGRAKEQVILKFYETVEPAHEMYTLPTREEADAVLNWSAKDIQTITIIAENIKNLTQA